MNKKLFSAALFGALLLGTASTFISCKDYDDDIQDLQTQVNDVKSALAALDAKVASGKYITSVSTTTDGIAISLNDGSSYSITNGKDGATGATGAAGADGTNGTNGTNGKDGTVITIDNDGFFVIDGETTPWKAVTSDGKIQKTPTVKDGVWVFYDENGEEVVSTYRVAPVTAVQNPDKSFTLTVYAADGTSQVVDVPTAASSVTDLSVITRDSGMQPSATTDDKPATLQIAEYAFEYNTNGYASAPAANKWKGQKAIVDPGYIMASYRSVKIQINPTTVDAADLDLTLVDSKNSNLSNFALTTRAYTGLENFTRAANVNGLYTLSFAEKYIKRTTADTEKTKFWNQFVAYFNTITGQPIADRAYAVTAGGNVRSKYEVMVAAETNPATYTKIGLTPDYWTSYQINRDETMSGSSNTANYKLDPNTWYYVVTDRNAALYDAHLVYSNDDAVLFGIETKEEDGVIAIRLTKTPDTITKAAFQLTIQNIDKFGTYNEAKMWLGETSAINANVQYDAITHELKKNNTVDTKKDVNLFQISLDKMKTALGTTGLALWNTKVNSVNVYYYNEDFTAYYAESTEISEIFTTKQKANLKDITDNSTVTYKDASNLVFAINNTAAAAMFEVGKKYNAYVVFRDNSGEELNSITVPFTFTLPAITTLFEIDPGFINNNVVSCYMTKADFDNNGNTAAFKLSRVFSKYDSNGFQIKLDANTKIVGDYTSAALATLTQSTVTANELSTIKLKGTLGEEKGYDQPLKLTISGKFDNAWEYPATALFNFTAKLMSPIEKGTITPKEGNVVKIKAADLNGYKFGNSVITGYTYNNEVTYKVMPNKVNGTTPTWTREDIKAVTGVSGNALYFTVDNGGSATHAVTGTDANGNAITVDGGLILNGSMVDHTVDTKITVKVKDIWNRVKASDIPVRITVGE